MCNKFAISHSGMSWIGNIPENLEIKMVKIPNVL